MFRLANGFVNVFHGPRNGERIRDGHGRTDVLKKEDDTVFLHHIERLERGCQMRLVGRDFLESW